MLEYGSSVPIMFQNIDALLLILLAPLLQVVAAEMTPSKRDLLLFCEVPGQPDDPDSFATMSISVGGRTLLYGSTL